MEKCVENYFVLNEEIKDKKTFDGNFVENGKSLYEVIRIIDGIPLFLGNHIKRLENSFKIEKLSFPVSLDNIKQNIFKLIEANKCEVGNVKLVFNYFENKCDFYGYFVQHKYPDEYDYINGVKTILYHGERSNPNAKVINLNFRKNVDKKIKEKGVFEAILVDRNGNITEGSKSNIFMVKSNTVYTAPVEDVLPGITREIIVEICKQCGYTVVDEKINYKKIDQFEGLFISGTSPKVLPICQVDDIKFNSQGTEMIRNIRKAYDDYISNYIKNFDSRS
ncbi:branched-chain amino acid aminotransferase [Clostridium acetobutylicum]|nr:MULTISPECIES: aminotransferase class IV [Clostridium]ADZ21277.1 Enzyme of ILVE/PABC family (branched-chain amino acid aminotransferase/4-amino-4-deoxychorismate lyase) [Clostridium acetobutylicum EA 2018]MBC2394637.1 aminotransferase class IV [Clostridium acetobutylicum]MBC2583599.1 aminotransferase class IV [Clostridium acetobutylicum]NOV88690.1 branched-chain amino acid aminotransferase [Clostridium acetobutylicum]NOW12968.1 branched-chain amino acid aminotransferase [Clostridium acetobut